MLDKQDLQAIREIIDTSITASEARTQAKLDKLEAKIEDVDSRWQVYAENCIEPNFKLLAEGHQTLLETMAPRERVDKLEEDVTLLKSVVNTLTVRVSELEKAR